MRTTFFKYAVATGITSAAVVLIAAGIASAHIDPDPTAMEAGTSATLAFNVEHGCNGSPTTSMKFQVPDGVSGVAPVDKIGWTATLTGNVLEFKGGPLAADQPDHFDISFTAPSQPGDIRFPVIQTCEQGELAWIEVAQEGAPEPEHPAPTIKITRGPPTSADLTPVPDATDVGTNGTLAATSGTDTAASPTVTTISDSSNGGAIVGAGIGAAIVVAGIGLMLVRRRKLPPQA